MNLNNVLWLDIAADLYKKSTRKFWIRATTKYHPWGYENDDDCSVLSASDRRDAMLDYGLIKENDTEEINIYKVPISLAQTWPYKAELPIPIYVFFKPFFNYENNNTISEEEFVEAVIQEIENKKSDKNESWHKKFWNNLNSNKDNIKALYDTFKDASKYFFIGTLLKDDVIKKETKNNKINNEVSTSLEVLFNRLGSGGTPITQAELIYSAIIAYWGEIKDENERLAEKYMSPTDLVLLAFRFVLTETEKNNKKLVGNPTIQRIRNLKNDENVRKRIIDFYANKKFESILYKVKIMLEGDDSESTRTPTILRLDVYKNHPNLMLLLMNIADKSNKVENEFIRAFVFYILWFGNDENKIIDIVFSKLSNEKLDNIKINIKKALFECLYNDLIIPIPIINNIFDEKPKIKKVYELLKYNKNVLLFAQREFLNKNFPNYKPVSSSDWENHNRPWDYDHIIPQNWVKGKRGHFREKSAEYLDTIANLAAIPFEINRSKSDSDDWKYYEKYKMQLYFCDEIKEINSNITYDERMTERFVNSCQIRMNLIYSNCNDAIFKHVSLYSEISQDNLPERALKRKEFFESLQELTELKEFKLYYYDGETRLEEEIDKTNLVDWSREWIILGYVDDGLMVSITSKDGEVYELGLSKQPDRPEKDNTTYENNKNVIDELKVKYDFSQESWWWYCKKDIKYKVQDEILEFIKYYNSNKKQ